MNPAPGSFLWLILYDLALNWRRFAELFQKLDRKVAIAVVAAAAVIAHVVAIPIANLFLKVVAAQGEGGRTMALAGFLGGMLAWMLAQGLLGAIRVIYVRGDMDLLVSSPLSPLKIFGAKALAIAAGSFGSVAILVLPVAHAGAILGHMAWLAAYPILIVVALAGTAGGLLLAMAIFWAAGPARARGVSQLVATVIAGGLVLGAQVWILLPQRIRTALSEWAGQFAIADCGRDCHMAGLVAAVTGGDWAVLVALLFASMALLAVAVFILGGVFVRATLSATGAPSGRQKRRPGDVVRLVTRGGAGRALRRKEWRLLLRDPNVFGQIALQMIYTVPVAIVLLRESNDVPMAIAPAVVVIAAQLSASIAWLTVSGEDAPELIATAPCVRADVDIAKLAAAAGPVAAIIALPILILATMAPAVALMTAVFAAAAATSTALLNVWHPMPGNRRGMLRRHSQSKLIAFAEHGFAMLWAIAVVFAVLGSWRAVIPALLVGMVIAIVMPGTAQRRAKLVRLWPALAFRLGRSPVAKSASGPA